jgi:hypothetical protein
MSGIGFLPGWAADTHPSRQFGSSERLAYGIAADIRNLTETVQKAECLQDGGINANAHAGISCLHSLQRGPRGEGAFSDDGHGQPTPPAGVVDIGAELA